MIVRFLNILFFVVSISCQQYDRFERTVNVNGLVRSFYILVPNNNEERNINSRQVLPVCLMFHGRGANATIFETETHITTTTHMVIFATGQPIGHSEKLGWDIEGDIDVLFSLTILQHVLTNEIGGFSVDENRIFVAGFSNGALLSFRLACEFPKFFTAFGFVGMSHEECSQQPLSLIQKPFFAQCGSEDPICDVNTYLELIPNEIKKSLSVEQTTATTTCYVGISDSDFDRNYKICEVQNFNHCWSGSGISNESECSSPNPLNVDSSFHLFKFFESLPTELKTISRQDLITQISDAIYSIQRCH